MNGYSHSLGRMAASIIDAASAMQLFTTGLHPVIYAMLHSVLQSGLRTMVADIEIRFNEPKTHNFS